MIHSRVCWRIQGFLFSISCSIIFASKLPGEEEEVITSVVHPLRFVNFVYPTKVSLTASFKYDLQMDMLDNVGVMMAVEEEFALNIPDDEANKISNTAHLIDYITNHLQAK